MNLKAKLALVALAFAVALSPALAQEVKVSEKQDIAVFGLGYYGWNIPVQSLGHIDMEIQKVFVDMGRFTVIGMQQRFSSQDVSHFIDTIRQAKQANFVMPEKYQFGEAVLTEAEFNRLLGAFIVAVPVVVNYQVGYNSKNGYYEASIETDVTFVDVASGNTMAIADCRTSGSDKKSSQAAVQSAIDGISSSLEYEIRSIPAFQINTRVLSHKGSQVKLQLGTNMGIQKGDEYAVIQQSTVEGFKDDHEVGLILIRDVASEVSTGTVLYNSADLDSGVQIREIPRQGIDFEPYFHITAGQKLTVPLWDGSARQSGSNMVAGLRLAISRGYYGFKPIINMQLPVNAIRTVGTIILLPICVTAGAEGDFYLGRFQLRPWAGVGGSYIYVSETLSGTSRDSSDTYIAHLGVQAYLNASILINRDTKIYAEAGGEYWLSMARDLYSNYGGLSLGGGVTFKL